MIAIMGHELIGQPLYLLFLVFNHFCCIMCCGVEYLFWEFSQIDTDLVPFFESFQSYGNGHCGGLSQWLVQQNESLTFSSLVPFPAVSCDGAGCGDTKVRSPPNQNYLKIEHVVMPWDIPCLQNSQRVLLKSTPQTILPVTASNR